MQDDPRVPGPPAAPPQRVVLQGWCSLLVPRDWLFSEEQGVTTIHAPRASVGAVNLSLFHTVGAPAREQLTREALRLATSLGAPLTAAEVRFVTVGGAPASYFEAADDAGDHWRTWHVGGNGRLVLLAYNCAAAEADTERELIDRIVRSFQWEEPATESAAAPGAAGANAGGANTGGANTGGAKTGGADPAPVAHVELSSHAEAPPREAPHAPRAEAVVIEAPHAPRAGLARRRRRRWPRLRRWLFPLILFALLYGRYLLGWAPAGGDLVNQYLPYQQLVREAMRSGELPLWNTMTFGGRPLMADVQVGVWYPPNWLHWLLPLPLSVTFALVLALHGAWMIAGCWYLGRHWRLARPAAALATALFCAGPFFTLRLTQGVILFIYVGAWWPWLALAVSRLMRRPSFGRLALLAGALALALLAGAPQIAYYGWLMTALLGATLAVMGPGPRRADLDPAAERPHGAGFALRRLGWLGAGFAFALGLAALQVLPTVEFVRQSFERGGAGAGWDYITDGSLAPRLLLLLLNPGYLGDPRQQDEYYWGKPPDFAEGCFYQTLWAPLLLVPVGLYLFLRSARHFRQGTIPGAVDLGLSFRAFRLHKLLAALALLAIVLGPLLALGKDSPLFAAAFQAVPGFNRFRVPARLMLFFNAGLALWAGLTLHRLLREPAPARLNRAGLLALAMGLLGLGAAALLQVNREAWWRAMNSPFMGPQANLEAMRAALAAYSDVQLARGAAGLVVAAGVLWFIARGRRRLLGGRPFRLAPLRTAGWVLGAIAALELLHQARPMRADTLVGQYTATHYPRTQLIELLHQHSRGGRVLWLDDVIGWQYDQNQPEAYPNRLIVHGLADARGYDPLNARWYGQWMNLLAGMPPDQNPRGFMFVPELARPAFLTPMGVDLVLTYQELPPLPGLQRVADLPFGEGTLHLWRNDDYRGPAQLAPLPRVMRDTQQALLMSAGLADAPTARWSDVLTADDVSLAYLAQADPEGLQAALGAQARLQPGQSLAVPAGRVQPTAERHNSRRGWEVELAQPTLLTIAESAWPGWGVRVDGQDQPLGIVMGTWLGVALPAGHHQVYLEYLPPGWVLGRMVTGISLLILLYGGLRGALLRRRAANPYAGR